MKLWEWALLLLGGPLVIYVLWRLSQGESILGGAAAGLHLSGDGTAPDLHGHTPDDPYFIRGAPPPGVSIKLIPDQNTGYAGTGLSRDYLRKYLLGQTDAHAGDPSSLGLQG